MWNHLGSMPKTWKLSFVWDSRLGVRKDTGSFGYDHKLGKSDILWMTCTWWCFQLCHRYICARWGHAHYQPCNCWGQSGPGPAVYSEGFVAVNKQPKFRLARSLCSKTAFLLLLKCPRTPPGDAESKQQGGSPGLGYKGPTGDCNLGSFPMRGPWGTDVLDIFMKGEKRP